MTARSPYFRNTCERAIDVALVKPLPQERLSSALAADVVQHEAAGNRPERRERARSKISRSLCWVTSTTISRSMTSGNDRKEESRNAMRNRPGPAECERERPAPS